MITEQRIRNYLSSFFLLALGAAVLVLGWRENLHYQERARVSERRELMSQAFAQMKIALIITNDRGVILNWNRGAQALLGWSADEMIGQPVEKLIPAEYREMHRIRFAQSQAQDRHALLHRDFECVALRKDGAQVRIINHVSAGRQMVVAIMEAR